MGGNPQASQGSLLACPDVLGEIDAHPRARRQGRRRSTRAAPAPPTTPTSGCRSCPAPTPRSCSRSCNVLFAEGLVDLGDARRPASTASTTCARSCADFTPERVADDVPASPPTTIRRLARELAAAPTRRGLRPHRPVQPGVRHARVVAGRRREHPHRQLRPSRRADVRQPGRVAGRRRCPTPTSADGVAFGRWTVARARRARGARPGAGRRAWPRRSRRRATGQIQALFTIAGNPVISVARRRRGSTPRCPSSTA